MNSKRGSIQQRWRSVLKVIKEARLLRRKDKMSSCYVDGWNLIFCCSRKKTAHNQVVYQEENTQDVVLDKQFIG